MKKKIITIVGTRPEIIRLSRIACALDKAFNHKIIHTGQNYDYELNRIFYEDLNIKKPSFYLKVSKKNVTNAVASILVGVDKILEKENPDAVVVLGDTNSALSVIAAKKRKIPIFHLEAGNRCFDQRVPEEINRKLVDHISDINLTYSTIAREYLLKEGLPSDLIIKIGSPMREVINYYKNKIINSKILKKYNLQKKKYFVISCHREENVDSQKNLKKLAITLNSIINFYKLPLLFSTHPRTRKIINKYKIKFNKKIKFVKPLGFVDYNNLQINSKAVLSDSGTISEESSILKFPALNLRENHERPEAMEEASVMMVGFDKERVLNGLKIILSSQSVNDVSDYGSVNVSEKVVKIIHSYIEYVNKKVWSK